MQRPRVRTPYLPPPSAAFRPSVRGEWDDVPELTSGVELVEEPPDAAEVTDPDLPLPLPARPSAEPVAPLPDVLAIPRPRWHGMAVALAVGLGLGAVGVYFAIRPADLAAPQATALVRAPSPPPVAPVGPAPVVMDLLGEVEPAPAPARRRVAPSPRRRVARAEPAAAIAVPEASPVAKVEEPAAPAEPPPEPKKLAPKTEIGIEDPFAQ